ncbi:MAG TPA: HAD-IIIC family phosphatase [Candidatus Limnocylindrales bacterium]|nr:HAD-IIIC family phosphatase [Candidatus Limnocylindrales bacterium]
MTSIREGAAQERPETATADPIKLVIWDLDETLWSGVLAEGPVELLEGRAALLRDLVDRGVMVSVSSRNDLQAAREELERHGLWELVVFPRINWNAKGAQVRDLIEAAQLRPPNVLFVDDNHLNREEAAFFAPGLQVADPAAAGFDDRMAAIVAAGKPDPARRRLGEYRLLEQRSAAAAEFGDNRAFLRASGIEVRLTDRPVADADRLAELVARTNQLNYTKRRLDREGVARLLQDPATRTVAVRVRDRFGDHGLVGFAAVTDGRVEQLAFSCRILGMGVERAVYDWLGRPAISIAEPVSAPLEGEPIDWLRLIEASGAETSSGDATAAAPVSPDAGRGRPSAAAGRVLMVGGCDLESALPFLDRPDAIVTHFNYSPADRPRLIVHRDSIDYLLADELPEATREAVLAEAPFLDAEALRAPDWSAFDQVVYSPLIDYVQAKYASAEHPGVYVSFGDVEQPAIDAERIASLAARYDLDPTRLRAFADRWQPVQKPDDVWRDQLRRLFARVPARSTLTVLLGATEGYGLDPEREATHRHHNELVAGVVAEFANATTLDVDPMLRERDDFTNSIRHYSRRVYHDLARELSARLWTGAPERPSRASAHPRKPAGPAAAARRVLRRGLRRLARSR